MADGDQPGRGRPRHFDRYREVANVLADEGFDWVVNKTGLSRFVPKGRRLRHVDGMTPEQHVRHALERLGVTFIKGGQALSTRTDILSPELAAELGRLQDEVPPESFGTVRSVVEAELEMPLEVAFASFEVEPLGSASVGQVHRAVLPDGTAVAVKVQRPGVRAITETDIEITLALAQRAQGAFTELADVDLVRLAGEFADALRGEFDYVLEARNAERLRRAFKDDETVVFPRVHWTHTTPRVLTLDLLEGVRMNRIEDLDAAGFDRPVLAMRGTDAYLRMIFEIGLFHADPHPGNFIAMEGDRVGFTDFGRVGTMSLESREAFIEFLSAVVDHDTETAAATMLEMSAAGVDEFTLQKDIGRMVANYYGRQLGGIRAADLFGDLLDVIRTHRLGVPNDFGMMLATLAVLEGLGTSLDPEFDFASAVTPFVERMMRARMEPAEIIGRVRQDLSRSLRSLERLPVTLDRIVRRLSRGEFRIEIAPRDYQEPLDELHELVNRLAFAIVVAALILGATNLLAATSVPPWLNAVGQVGLVAALVVSVWLFWSIISAHYRARRKRRP